MQKKTKFRGPSKPRTQHIEPYLFREQAAAIYVDRSTSWLRNTRSQDGRKLKEMALLLKQESPDLFQRVTDDELDLEEVARQSGIKFRPVIGPRWVRDGRTIYYRKVDLDNWLATFIHCETDAVEAAAA